MGLIIGSQDEKVLTSLGRSVSMDISRDINEFNVFLPRSDLYREIKANKQILKKIRSTITHNYISILNNSYVFILCNSAGYALDIISDESQKNTWIVSNLKEVPASGRITWGLTPYRCL